MSDCLLCDWNRNRNFNVNRGLPAKCAGGAVRGIAVVFSRQPRTPLHRAARKIALRAMQYRSSTLWYWKFVWEPTLEGGISYGGYFTQSTKWGVFLMSLKALLETGKGAPEPNDIKIDNWN
jgi:hypothetical protein